MKILFITDNFPPEVNAPATRTYEHAIEWVKKGTQVTIITCHPNFPQGKLFVGYRNNFRTTELIDGIKVIRVWSYMSANSGFIKRILDYISFALMAIIVGLFEKTDIIIATSPQFFTTWSAKILSFFKRKPWIFELRDLWPESIVTVGAIDSKGLLYKLLEKIELHLYRDSKLIIANSPAFKTNLIERGIEEYKIEVVPNGSNLELFDRNKINSVIRRKLGLEGKFVIGYIGTHGLAHSLDFILQTIAVYKTNFIHFLFIGDGSEKSSLVNLSQELGLNNVSFLDPVPKEKMPEYLAAVDVSLAPLRKSDTFKTVIPSKIFEAAAMGKPVLLGVEGQAKEIIEKYQAGICFEPENKASLISAIETISKDNKLYDEMVNNTLLLAKDFDRKKLAQIMLSHINDAIRD